MFGREPILPVDTILKPVDDKLFANLPEYARQLAQSLKTAYEIARARIGVMQDRNASAVDENKKELEFHPGD